MRRIHERLLLIAAFFCGGVIESHAATLMTHHLHEVTRNGQATLVGRLPATQILQLDVWFCRCAIKPGWMPSSPC
jgi:hypothetical protein